MSRHTQRCLRRNIHFGHARTEIRVDGKSRRFRLTFLEDEQKVRSQYPYEEEDRTCRESSSHDTRRQEGDVTARSHGTSRGKGQRGTCHDRNGSPRGCWMGG